MEMLGLDAQRGKKYRPVFLPERRYARFTMETNEFTGMDHSFIRYGTQVGGVSRDELRHALCGVHAHGHADEILNLIKELK